MTPGTGSGSAGWEPVDDSVLLGLLAQAIAEVDPVPESLLAAAEGLFEVRNADLDAELAALVADSAVDQVALTVRSGSGSGASGSGASGSGSGDGEDDPRLLTFQAGDLAIEVEVEAEEQNAATGRVSRRAVRGQVVPRQELDVLAVSRAASADLALERRHEARTDASGRFRVDDVRPGPFRLIFRRAGKAAVVTAWVLLA